MRREINTLDLERYLGELDFYSTRSGAILDQILNRAGGSALQLERTGGLDSYEELNGLAEHLRQVKTLGGFKKVLLGGFQKLVNVEKGAFDVCRGKRDPLGTPLDGLMGDLCPSANVDVFLMPDIVRSLGRNRGGSPISDKVHNLISTCDRVRSLLRMEKAKSRYAFAVGRRENIDRPYADELRKHGITVLEVDSDWTTLSGLAASHPGYVPQAMSGLAGYLIGWVKSRIVAVEGEDRTNKSVLVVGGDFQLSFPIEEVLRLGGRVALLFPEEKLDSRWRDRFTLQDHTTVPDLKIHAPPVVNFYPLTSDLRLDVSGGQGGPISKRGKEGPSTDLQSFCWRLGDDSSARSASGSTRRSASFARLRSLFSESVSKVWTELANLQRQGACDDGSHRSLGDALWNLEVAVVDVNTEFRRLESERDVIASLGWFRERDRALRRLKKDRKTSMSARGSGEQSRHNGKNCVVVWPDIQIVRKALGLKFVPADGLVGACREARGYPTAGEEAKIAFVGTDTKDPKSSFVKSFEKLGFEVLAQDFDRLSLADPGLGHGGYTPQRASGSVGYWLGCQRAAYQLDGSESSKLSLVIIGSDFQLAGPISDLIQAGHEVILAFPQSHLDLRWFKWFRVENIKNPWARKVESREGAPSLKFWDLTFFFHSLAEGPRLGGDRSSSADSSERSTP